MKITRSALKNLIKEEMNRINEDEPGDPTGSAIPTTVTGMDAPKYMFDGMDWDDIQSWFNKATHSHLGREQDNDHKVSIEGIAAAERSAKTWQYFVDGDRQNGQRRSVDSDKQSYAPGVVFTLSFNVTQEESDAKSTGYVRATLSRYGGNDNDTESWLTKNVIDPFNSQNSGKGGKITQGGTSSLLDDFGWSWRYHS